MGFKLDDTSGNKLDNSSSFDLDALLKKEITFFGTVFSSKKKEDFYTELSVLLGAGITLKEALTLIQQNYKKENLKIFFKSLLDSLVAGASFSSAIQAKKEFTEYEYHSIKIGEETGTLQMIAKELGKFYARKNEQRRSIVNALTYPIIILITALLVVVFMLRLVVPMFQDIFKQNNVELPAITRFIIATSDVIKDYGLLFLGMIFLLILFRKLISKNIWFKKNRDYFFLKLPYVGKLIKVVYLAQFTQALTLLTSSMVPVLQSIGLVSQMIDFYPLKESLSSVEQKIVEGSSLSDSLKGSKMFDDRMISMIKVSEETNQTAFIFERLNEQYSIEAQQKSKLLSTLLEPFIILFVGVLVGVILVAMYLPMFKLGSVLG